MNERVYQLLRENYALKERDVGEFAHIRAKGMRFEVRVFDAADAGSLCLMTMKAFFGLMKMESAVFSPVFRDAPIYSCDGISAFGNDSMLMELYDTTLTHPAFEELQAVKDRYAALPDYDSGSHWYDDIRLPVSALKKGKKLQKELAKMAEEYSAEYFRLFAQCDPCSPEEKKARNGEYAQGLLNNGGPAVDQFKKILGEEKTAEFLKTVMFCCA